MSDLVARTGRQQQRYDAGCRLIAGKTQQDEFSPEGLCRAAMYALFVNEELESWPEQNTRNRSWVTIPEAIESCRHAWMRDALVIGFNKWHAQHMNDES
ncbi:Nudix hydrolase 16, mitochondrial, partial [Cucurbita argyrosperma subsp. argyrosperma]